MKLYVVCLVLLLASSCARGPRVDYCLPEEDGLYCVTRKNKEYKVPWDAQKHVCVDREDLEPALARCKQGEPLGLTSCPIKGREILCGDQVLSYQYAICASDVHFKRLLEWCLIRR